MRSWKDLRSPWGKQLRFDDHEFDAMMDELRGRAGEGCFSPGRGVDVDLVLLRAEGVEADYVDLPAGVLGRTVFARDGSVQVEISRALCEEAETNHVARRRLRSTIAHECGHIACHRILFRRDVETYSLFPDAELEPAHRPVAILCRPDAIASTAYNGEWWEFQANQCMASLLLPRRATGAFVRRLLAEAGHESGEQCLVRGEGEVLVRTIATEYDVSQTATLYRLQSLGFFPKNAQASMRLAD